MGATSDNYDIVTSGISYTIASDYVNASNAHFQFVKVAYGSDGTATSVSTGSPLPVKIYDSIDRYDLLSSGYYSLATTLVGFTGSTPVKVIGVSGGQAVGVTFGTAIVSATDLDIRTLYGGTVGHSGAVTASTDYVGVQGISGAYPVGITFNGLLPVSVSSFTNMGVFGVSGATAIGVTFSTVSIRGLTAASDSVLVYGLAPENTVSTSLYGFAGTTSTIEAIYSSNNALNVNVSSIVGVTVAATDLDIRNLDYTIDTVKVIGDGASDNAVSPKATVPTYINALGVNGSLLQVGGITGSGWSAAALNVNMVNSGITFAISASATFSSVISVHNQGLTAIYVQGSTAASYGVWVTGSTNGDPVVVKGSGAGGALTVNVNDFTTQTNAISELVGQVKTNTDFMSALKKALYSETVSVGAFDFNDANSIYGLIKNSVGTNISTLKDSIIPNGLPHTTQSSMAVSVVGVKQQPSFMARTGSASNTSQNLTAFNGAAGYTCANGVRIKASRVATGANASQNEIMCVISEADASLYGASAGSASYVLYHGDEMFFEVDNINRIKVFYPSYSAGFAPHNTGTGMTFSFYAS